MGKKKANKKMIEDPVKGKKAAPVKPATNSDDDDSSEEEEVQVKPLKKGGVKALPLKASRSSSGYESFEGVLQGKTGVKRAIENVDDDSTSDDEDDEEEEVEETPVKKNFVAAKRPGVLQGKTGVKRAIEIADEDSTSDDDDDDEEVEAPVKTNVMAGKKPVQQLSDKIEVKKTNAEESSSEEDDDSDEEVTSQPTTKLSPQKRQPAQLLGSKTAGKIAKAGESSSDEEDDSDEEEESEEEKVSFKQILQQKNKPVQKPQKPLSTTVLDKTKAASKKSAPVKQKDTSDSSEETSSEVSSSDEEMVKVVVKNTVQNIKPGQKIVTQKGAQVEDSDEEDESSDNEEDEEDSDEEEEETVKVPESKKRKTENTSKEPSFKKQQVDGGAKAVNKVKAVKTKKSIDEEDSDEEEEEKTVKVPESKKRKKEKIKKEVTSKKQKLEAVNGREMTISLFVGNLLKTTSKDEISEFFLKNGIGVKEVRKLPRKVNAFVDLEDSNDLKKALALNGSTLDNNIIKVEKAKPRIQQQSTEDNKAKPWIQQQSTDDNKNHLNSSNASKGENDKTNRTLFVKNLPEDVKPKNLKKIFDTALDIRIPQKGGVYKSFGFIEFKDAETMETALSEKQGVELNGNSLVLDYTGARSSYKMQPGPGGKKSQGNFEAKGNKQISSGSRGETKVLFVKNLSYSTDESSLKAAFEGAVSARIPTFPDSGKSKGFAFVDFKTPEAAAEAFEAMSGQSIDGRQVKLDFATSGGGGRGGFSHRGRGGKGGRGNKGGFNKGRESSGQSQAKKAKFNEDSD